MKQPLPPSIAAALAEVEAMADQLAATFCDYPAKGLMPAETAACLDNLDTVAAALTWQDLENAPAMLNAVARAYRQSFPSDSLGWEDAGRLQTIASDIAHWQTLPDNGSGTGSAAQDKANAAWNYCAAAEAAVMKAETLHGRESIQAAAARSAYQAARAKLYQA